MLLSGSFGAVFQCSASCIQIAITDKEDPIEAVRDFLARHAAGTLLPVTGCDCGGECHSDDHGHDHSHEAPQYPGSADRLPPIDTDGIDRPSCDRVRSSDSP